MAILPIRLFPDPVLRKRCTPVRTRQTGLAKFVADLAETLYAQPAGIGIAAPQVGIGIQLAIVDVSPRNPSCRRETLINPKILRLEGEVASREGCMSLPDYSALIRRSSKVLVSWVDGEGRKRKKWATGIEAICLQHEIDHLNGVLFIDRVASLKTDVFPRRKGP